MVNFVKLSWRDNFIEIQCEFFPKLLGTLNYFYAGPNPMQVITHTIIFHSLYLNQAFSYSFCILICSYMYGCLLLIF